MDVGTQVFVWFSNLTLLMQDWFCFLRVDNWQLSFMTIFGAAPQPLIVYYLLAPQCWTVGVEMTFYLIPPFMCRRWWTAAGLFGFGLAARFLVAQWQPPLQDPWLYRFAPAEMLLFASGSLSYFFEDIACARISTKNSARLVPELVSGAILANDYVAPWSASHLSMYWQPLYLMKALCLYSSHWPAHPC